MASRSRDSFTEGYEMMAGRPRALDLDIALPVILRLFWERGYSGQTLDQVAAELGVTKPTLCRTLGDKDAIFVAALGEYHQSYIAPAEDYLTQAGTLREGLHGFFGVFVARIVDDDLPPGCFMGDTAATSGFNVGTIAETLETLLGRLASTVHQQIEAAIDNGELGPTTSAAPVLQFVLGQISALAAISRSGPTRAQLDTVVEYMLNGLPWTAASGTSGSSERFVTHLEAPSFP
jgi:AcrR family transcriptional regulator